MIRSLKYLSIQLIIPAIIYGQLDKQNIQSSIEKRANDYEKIAKSIWSWAELGYQEEKSSALLIETLSKDCLLYTSPSPRDQRGSRMPSSA